MEHFNDQYKDPRWGKKRLEIYRRDILIIYFQNKATKHDKYHLILNYKTFTLKYNI